MVWAENPAVSDDLTLEQYLAAGHVVARLGREQMRSAEEQYIADSGIDRRIEAVVMGFSMLPQFVIGTSRIATLHTRLARHYAEWLPLRLLKPPIEIPPLVEVMQWHHFRSDDRGLAWLRRTLLDAAR